MLERGLRLKLGAFIAGSLAVLAGLVVFFGRAPELFSNKAAYDVLFSEAPGIGPGTPIRKSGVPIGQVASIDLDPESGLVRVKVRIDRKYLPRKNEDATITRGILNGDTAIDFLPKLDEAGQPVARGEVWPPGSTIPGVPPITPRSLLTPASGVLANAQQSLDRMVRAFEKLEKLERLGPKLETALDEFTGLARDARGFLPELKKTNQKFQNLLSSDAPEPKLPGVPPADDINIKSLIRDIQDLVRVVRPTVDDLRASIRKLEPEVAGAVKSAKAAFDGVNDVLSPENRKQLSGIDEECEQRRRVHREDFRSTHDDVGDSGEGDQEHRRAGHFGGERSRRHPGRDEAAALKSESLIMSVTESAEQLNKALVEVRGLLQTFGRGNGTIQRLLTDPTVYQNLDAAAGSLARVMGRAEKISRDLEVFSDKIARRPELIGVGGAFRPSSGLKDLPGSSLPAYRTDWPPAEPARPRDGAQWIPPPVQGYPPR